MQKWDKHKTLYNSYNLWYNIHISDCCDMMFDNELISCSWNINITKKEFILKKDNNGIRTEYAVVRA